MREGEYEEYEEYPEEEQEDDEESSWEFSAEDILATGAAIVAIILALGIVLWKLDPGWGIAGILGLVGAGAIAEVVKARNRP